MAEAAQDLEDLLADLDRAASSNGAKVSVGEIMETIGKRSFGPLLLLGGLLGMTPVAAVPTAPSIIALITILVSVQLLFGRESVWIPRFLEKVSVKADKVKKTVKVSRKPARVIDRMVKPRLEALTRPWADRVVALVCMLVAMIVPPLELLPFVAFVPAAAIATFGLGLIARDGLLVLIAFVISTTALGLAVWKFLLS
ncbi:exopolysaccharide biosynthesis protein [Phenylobacterium sp.]|uniref:exopolysaccharide biosynthesis protein n=1 Tax=Phenylobacterium sp. TaxID=1871053 RepID=UPI002BBC96AF|nr:exopolysaccharide biosynthesis protein [Phenylobacterium sp.]HVI33050.1 exopolysaccharide biosynthesis protein [Phenylobacterium sp.]